MSCYNTTAAKGAVEEDGAGIWVGLIVSTTINNCISTIPRAKKIPDHVDNILFCRLLLVVFAVLSQLWSMIPKG